MNFYLQVLAVKSNPNSRPNEVQLFYLPNLPYPFFYLSTEPKRTGNELS